MHLVILIKTFKSICRLRTSFIRSQFTLRPRRKVYSRPAMSCMTRLRPLSCSAHVFFFFLAASWLISCLYSCEKNPVRYECLWKGRVALQLKAPETTSSRSPPPPPPWLYPTPFAPNVSSGSVLEQETLQAPGVLFCSRPFALASARRADRMKKKKQGLWIPSD